MGKEIGLNNEIHVIVSANFGEDCSLFHKNIVLNFAIKWHEKERYKRNTTLSHKNERNTLVSCIRDVYLQIDAN